MSDRRRTIGGLFVTGGEPGAATGGCVVRSEVSKVRFIVGTIAAAVLLSMQVSTAFAAGPQLARFKQIEPNVVFWRKVFTEYTSDQIVYHDPWKMGLVYSVLDVSDITRSNISDGSKERAVRKRRDAEAGRVKALLRRISHAGPRTDEERRIADAIKGLNHERVYAKTLADRIRSQRGLGDKFCPAMQRAKSYMPMMRKAMREQGVPEELASLPLVESGYQIGAHSHVGAAGMWQFTNGTGRLFMKIDGYRDERRDPYTATHGAARLLASNYKKLGSWPLAITAYNHGAAGMARAVRQVGTKDLGVIVEAYKSRSFGFASRNFYAEFLAAASAVADAEKICGPLNVPAYSHDRVELAHYVALGDLAQAAGVSAPRLAELNPALLRGVVSGYHRVPKGYGLNLPAGTVSGFHTRYAALPSGAKHTTQPEQKHRVGRGETLTHIARAYKVSVRDLQAFNNLRDPRRLRAGQTIRIPIKGRASTTKPAAPTRTATVLAAADAAREAAAKAVKTTPTLLATAARETATPPTTSKTTHRVGRGQTLSQIAVLYKTSVSELKRLNGIGDPRKLRSGERITVPLRGAAVASAGAAMPPGDMTTVNHAVARGETLWSIAAQYRTSVATLQSLNSMRDPSRLRVGQRIRVPESGGGSRRHTVRRGQTLSEIATAYRTSVGALKSLNGIRDPRSLKHGQVLKIPN